MKSEKISDFESYTVSVPIEAPIRHSNGVHPGWFTMTLVKIQTSSGYEAWGEVGGGGFSLQSFLRSNRYKNYWRGYLQHQRIQWKYTSPITATYYNQLFAANLVSA